MRVERMRHAILQGLQPDVVFAKPILPLMPQMYPPQSHMNVRPAGAPLPVGRGGGRGRGLLGKCPPMFKKGNHGLHPGSMDLFWIYVADLKNSVNVLSLSYRFY